MTITQPGIRGPGVRQRRKSDNTVGSRPERVPDPLYHRTSLDTDGKRAHH